MNFLKKLFSKMTAPSDEVVVHMLLNISEIRFKEQYMDALFSVVGQEITLKDDDQFSLEFGTPTAIHILSLNTDVLHVLMEPENDGWTATKVYIDRVTSDKGSNTAYNDMTLLFNIPNSMYGQKTYVEDGIEYRWTKYAKVYAAKAKP